LDADNFANLLWIFYFVSETQIQKLNISKAQFDGNHLIQAFPACSD